MKYSKETLKRIKEILDGFENIAIEDYAGVENRLKELNASKSLAQNQKNAVDEIGESIRSLARDKNAAASWSNRIEEYLNQDNDYPSGWREEELDGFLDRIKVHANSLSENVNTYLVRDNNDDAPGRNDKMWNLLPYAGKIKQASDGMTMIKSSESFEQFKEGKKAFDENMTYLNAMSMSNSDFSGSEVDLKDLAEELSNTRKELGDAQKELTALENGRDRWKENYETAVKNVGVMETELNRMSDEIRDIDEQLETARDSLDRINELRNQYNTQKSQHETWESFAQESETKLDNVRRRHKEAHDNADKYPALRDFAMYNGKNLSEEDRNNIRDYADAKEAQLRWSKAAPYADELESIMKDDAIVKMLLFAKAAKKAKNGFLGFGKSEAVAGFPPRYLADLENGLGVASKERLARGRELISKIQQAIPDDKKGILDKPFLQDGLTFMQELKQTIEEEKNAATKRLEDNPVYKRDKELRDELKALTDNVDQLSKNQDNAGAGGEDMYESALESLKDEAFKARGRLANNPTNPEMIDKVIADHVSETEKLAELDEELNDRINDAERARNGLKETSDEMYRLRTQALGYADPNYQELRRKDEEIIDEEKKRIAGENAKKKGKKAKNADEPEIEKPSDVYRDKLLADNDMQGEKTFDKMEARLNEMIATQKTNLETIQKQHSDKNLELVKGKNNIKKYSFKNYKEALSDASRNVDKLKLKEKKLSMMKGQLDKAKENYNKRVAHINKAVAAVDESKKTIMDQINEFKADFDKNKKTGHQNKPEYTALGNKLNEFSEEAVAGWSPSQLSAKLTELGTAAKVYDDAKEREWRPFASAQRTFRRAFAKNIKSFADTHSKTLNELKVDNELWNEIKEAKNDPPVEIHDDEAFAAKADELKGSYVNGSKKFTDIISDIKVNFNQDMIGYNPEAAKEFVTDSMVYQELGKKVFDFNPQYKTMTAQALELEKEKVTLNNEIKHRYSDTIDKFVQKGKEETDLHYKDKLSEKNKTTGRKIAGVKSELDARQKYKNVQPYGPEAENVLDQQKKIAQPVLQGPK